MNTIDLGKRSYCCPFAVLTVLPLLVKVRELIGVWGNTPIAVPLQY